MKLVVYDKLYIDNLTRKREGETRLGEKVQTLPWNNNDLHKSLEDSTAKYVLIGLPEDIGVRANGGRGGAYSAWTPVLNTLLNSQSNHFLSGEELLVLGHVDFTDEMQQVKDYDFHSADDITKARTIVSAIDDYLVPLFQKIASCGKEAIVIGGGHNNSYPIIKGIATGLKDQNKVIEANLNIINCDAHSDFRLMEGRHSGNPFSYAFHENYIYKYSVIGLHESYNTAASLKALHKEKERIYYITFEDMFVREVFPFDEAVEKAIGFSRGNFIGLEIDLDSIQNIPASAKTSSGINTIDARKYIHKIASSCNTSYLHIAEAAPVLSHIKTDLKTGKLVTYLIADYIKARLQWEKKINSENIDMLNVL